MVVHKKVAKAVRKVGKKVVRKALNSVGVRTRKPVRPRVIKKFLGSRVSPAAKAAKRPRKVRPAVENPRFRKGRAKRGPRGAKGSRKVVGPPGVGMRTVKGRGGRLITIKRPRPRNV